MFTMTCPSGQEAELTGFYLYSANILVWVPPLIFTFMNQNGVSMQWELFSLVFFFVIGIFFLFLMDPWDKICNQQTTEDVLEMSNVEVAID